MYTFGSEEVNTQFYETNNHKNISMFFQQKIERKQQQQQKDTRTNPNTTHIAGRIYV